VYRCPGELGENSSRARAREGSKQEALLAARLEAATSPKAAERSLGLDGSETRPYTTIRDPSLHGQGCDRRGPYPPGSVYEACRGWEASGLSPTSRKSGEKWGTPARCFREKHAEPKAQDVIVSSLQDSVVAYL